jgi:hypothetical protein
MASEEDVANVRALVEHFVRPCANPSKKRLLRVGFTGFQRILKTAFEPTCTRICPDNSGETLYKIVCTKLKVEAKDGGWSQTTSMRVDGKRVFHRGVIRGYEVIIDCDDYAGIAREVEAFKASLNAATTTAGPSVASPTAPPAAPVLATLASPVSSAAPPSADGGGDDAMESEPTADVGPADLGSAAEARAPYAAPEAAPEAAPKIATVHDAGGAVAGAGAANADAMYGALAPTASECMHTDLPCDPLPRVGSPMLASLCRQPQQCDCLTSLCVRCRTRARLLDARRRHAPT